jgi:hypothetical protein
MLHFILTKLDFISQLSSKSSLSPLSIFFLFSAWLKTPHLNQRVWNLVVDLSGRGGGVVASVEGEGHRLVRVRVLRVDRLLRLRDKDGALVVDLVHVHDVLKW